MKIHLLYLFLLPLSLFVSVLSKTHREHESLFRQTDGNKDKDTKSTGLFDGNYSILPTLFFFETSRSEPESDEIEQELLDSGALGVSDEDQRNTAILLSDQELSQLFQSSGLEQQDVVEEGEEGGDKNKMVAETKDLSIQENDPQHKKEKCKQKNEKELKEEDMGSSTDLEIPMDLDYVTDSGDADSLNTKLEEKKTLIMTLEDESKMNDEIPRDMEDYNSQLKQSDESLREFPYAPHVHTKHYQDLPESNAENDQSTTNEGQVEEIREAEFQNKKSRKEVAKNKLSGKKGEKKHTNESDGQAKEKGKKKSKRHHLRMVQRYQMTTVETSSGHAENQDLDENVDSNLVQRAHRKKNKKWVPPLGMNPVQIRATVDLFTKNRPKPRVDTNGLDFDVCKNFPCKRGKICRLNQEKKPRCVCQESADCPPSFNEFDHVCGSDNQTYNSACQLFATKCSLEGSKKGHRLHLKYTGSCKFIPPCLESELAQFPLQMKDWLKNVLLQLYEHDLLTPKQKSKVQKVYESERRLRVGDHPIELLALDFDKNYNMYIYPVHWQFAQMDQHPSDGALSHSELAPLRAPLVPMEHCTSVFFQKCDADKDKLLSFSEWCRCFGIKDEDVDTKLLF